MIYKKKNFASRIKGFSKLFCFCLVCLPSFIVQPPFLLFRDQRQVCRIPMFWHRWICKIMGIRVIVKGTPSNQGQTFFVSNHLSYLDIPVIGQTFTTYFIAKKEVETWPLFGRLSKLQKTLFIKRSRDGLSEASAKIANHLHQNHSLTIFPEGTSSSGRSVLPFKSSLFDVFFNQSIKEQVLIQPFTIKLLEVDGKPPKEQEDYDLYAWHGDMELPPHLWNFACSRGAVIELVFHEPFQITSQDDRKTLCQKSHKLVSKGLNC